MSPSPRTFISNAKRRVRLPWSANVTLESLYTASGSQLGATLAVLWGGVLGRPSCRRRRSERKRAWRERPGPAQASSSRARPRVAHAMRVSVIVGGARRGGVMGEQRRRMRGSRPRRTRARCCGEPRLESRCAVACHQACCAAITLSIVPPCSAPSRRFALLRPRRGPSGPRRPLRAAV